MLTSDITTATWLTIIRLVISPLVLPMLLVHCLPPNNIWLNSGLACLFILLSVTDFLDGYLARAYKQESVLGKVLDPIADKFLFYSTLIGLLAAGKMLFYWVLILIGREFFVMALRYVALERGFSISVSWLGKVKTVLQMATLTFVIINPYQELGLGDAPIWNGTELVLLCATVILSVFSAYRYYKVFMTRWKQA